MSSRKEPAMTPMTLRERFSAAWTILRGSYIGRVDIAWTRPDGFRASRIYLGMK